MGTAFFITLMSVLITVLITQILINIISARIGKIKKINTKISKINEFFKFLLLTVFEPENDSIRSNRERIVELFSLPLSTFFDIKSIKLYNCGIDTMNHVIEKVIQIEYDKTKTVMLSMQEKDKYLFKLLSEKPQVDYFAKDIREMVQKKIKVLEERKAILDEKIKFYRLLNSFDRNINVVFEAFCDYDKYPDEDRKNIILNTLRDRYYDELCNYNSIRNFPKTPFINEITRW